MELARPITKGIIMCGNTTTSRSGTIGSVSITSALSLSLPNICSQPRDAAPLLLTSVGGVRLWRVRRPGLPDLLDQGDGLLPVQHDVPGDHALLDFLHRGQVVHQVEHQVLDDHPQTARADLPRDGEVG